MERKPIGKKLRFEVFKRDSFTCQYCGHKAPDVILEVDHINPVKERGTNSIMNLITSCKDCNRGKGALKLNDNQMITKQQEQMEEINQRREQLKLMLKWKDELENFENEQVGLVEDIILNITGYSFNDYGKKGIKKAISEFGVLEVIESAKISINQYYIDSGVDEENRNSVEKVIYYIPRICSNRKKQIDNPLLCKQNHIRAVMKNRFPLYNLERVRKVLSGLVINNENYETLLEIAKSARNWSDFWDIINTEFKTNY